MKTSMQSEAAQQAFFEAALEASFNAKRTSPGPVARLRVADVRMDLEFAGDQLMPLFLPALRHLVVDDAEPTAITLHIWDSKSTGVQLPPPPVPMENFTDRGDIWGFESARFRTAFHWVECSVNTFDADRGQGVYWVQDSSRLPFWAKASPLRTLLHWSLIKHGVQLVHAAAVGTEDGAVLITGRGGVGKSSTALSALARGLQYVGDDYLAIRVHPEPAAFSLYSTAKLNAEDVERYPLFAPYVTNLQSMQGEKAVVQLFPDFNSQIAHKMPLRAIVTPRVVPQVESAVAPIERLQLLRAAAFTTLSQLPYAGQETYGILDSLVDRLPGYELQLGSDRAGNVRKVQNLLIETKQHGSNARTQGSDQLPLISVVVPVFNGSHFLGDAVANILSQDYPNLEIFVVNDGSQEPVEDHVRKLPVDVRYLIQDNAGPAAARNRAIREASGDFLAFLDVDDLWEPGALRALHATLTAEADLAVVHGLAQMQVLDVATQAFVPEGNPLESFPYYIGAGLYRRSAFQKVGLFDGSLRFAEDTDWYTRLKESGLPYKRLMQVTLNVRRHGANMTAQKTPDEMRATSLLAFRKALERAKRAKSGT